MPKNRLNDWSRTAGNNTDISGIGIQGSNSPRNLDDAFRAMMAQVADWRVNTPLDDTASWNNEDDDTKTFSFSGEDIPTATDRVINIEDLYTLIQTPPRGYISGLTTSNNVSDATNDIDIAVGMATDSTNADLMVLASALTKRLDAAWAVGTGNGGLDTGVIDNASYHVHLIKRLDTGVVDALFSLSATSPTLPDDYDVFRRICSIRRRAAAIVTFSQRGDEFLYDDPLLDVSTSSLGTTAALLNVGVPDGINVDALLRCRGTNAAGWSVLISSPNVTNQAPSGTLAPLCDIGGTAGTGDRATIRVRTNTSSEVRARSSIANTELQISCYGYIDTRGK